MAPRSSSTSALEAPAASRMLDRGAVDEVVVVRHVLFLELVDEHLDVRVADGAQEPIAVFQNETGHFFFSVRS